MKSVFIDTNVYLAFYEVTKDDLEKLTEAFSLAAEQEISFVTTEHVKAEFSRRRNAIVANSIERFSELRIPALPAMAKGLAQTKGFLDARKVMAETHKALSNALSEEAKKQALSADQAVEKLFDASKVLVPHAETVAKANLRIDCGNPPGKRGSLGDAINWECLLEAEKFHGDLIVVSQDRDFRDPLDKKHLDSFLRQEWTDKHQTAVFLFDSLGDFINAYFGEADIKSFEQIDSKVSALAGSESFYETHTAIAELSSVSYFTRKQAIRLVQALEANSQVNWIFSDDDVKEFYSSLLKTCGDKMDIYEVNYLEEMIGYSGYGPAPMYIPF